jgi:hypothetical protein
MYKIIKTTTSVIEYEILTIQNKCFMFACVCHVWEGVLFFSDLFPFYLYLYCKESLKTPNEQPEASNRRTDRQQNDQKKKEKQGSTYHHTEDQRWSNTNPTKTRSELRCSGRVSSSSSTCDTRRVTVKRHEYHLIL